jgi:Mrp family chromosome partitioning ATPase
VLDPSPERAANLANDIAATLIRQQTQVTKPTTTQGTTAPGTAQGTQAQGATGQNNFMVIAQSAQPATTPARPNKIIYVGAGLLIGLLLGILLALLLEPLDTRVRTKETLAQLLGWPVLGTVWRTARNEAVINPMGYNANSESYGNLHMNIGFAASNKPLHTLVITSATPRDGKSVVAANLAIFMARSGKNTLLIDANLRHPVLHEQFGIPAYAMGFSNALLAFRAPRSMNASVQQQYLAPAVYTGQGGITGELMLDSFLRSVNIPNLYVMPSGPLPPNPPELLDSKALERFFLALSTSGVEVVIFDCPALLGLPDAAILASRVDATLVVVDTTRARKKDLTQVKTLLEQAASRVIGCVMNKQRRSKDSPYKNTPYSYYHNIRTNINKGRDNSGWKNTHVTAVPPVQPAPPRPAISAAPKVREAAPPPVQREQRDGEKRMIPQAVSSSVASKPRETASRPGQKEQRDGEKQTPSESLNSVTLKRKDMPSMAEQKEQDDGEKNAPSESLSTVTQKRRETVFLAEQKEQDDGEKQDTNNVVSADPTDSAEHGKDKTDETITLPTVKKRETGE